MGLRSIRWDLVHIVWSLIIHVTYPNILDGVRLNLVLGYTEKQCCGDNTRISARSFKWSDERPWEPLTGRSVKSLMKVTCFLAAVGAGAEVLDLLGHGCIVRTTDGKFLSLPACVHSINHLRF